MLSVDLMFAASWLRTAEKISGQQLSLLASSLETCARQAAMLENFTVPAEARAVPDGENIIDFAAARKARQP